MPERSASFTVTLEAVTPLFLGGANPRGAPELRAPSLRGALRYWLRAALGGVIGDNNLEALHQLESRVFGSTEFGSPVHVRVKPVGGELRYKPEKILPHKEGQQAGSRQAIQSGQQFELMLSMPYRGSEEAWAAAITALRLAVTFGGVGLRSRRGFGTLRVIQSTDQTQLPLSPTSLQGWQRFAVQGAENAIDACRRLAQTRNVPTLAGPPSDLTSFPCANKRSLILISDPGEPSAMGAVIKFMQQVHQVPRNAAFGGISPRRASPLWVRPIQAEKGYGLLFLVLASGLATGTNYTNYTTIQRIAAPARAVDVLATGTNYTNYTTIEKFLNHSFPGVSLQAKGWNV